MLRPRLPWTWSGIIGEGRFRRSLGAGLVIATAFIVITSSVAAAAFAFGTPTRMGYPAGDDWEPAVASDGFGNVYVLLTHFGGVPGCGACGNPSMLVQVSHDGGSSFTAPVPLTVNGNAQYDPQVKINAQGYVFVSYLLGKDTVLQRSTDHGLTWTNPTVVNVGIKQGATDKDGLAVDGANIYVGFDVAQRFFVAASHDYGNTFTVAAMNSNTLGWPLNGGAAIGPDSSVYMIWELVHKSGQAQGPQDVAVTVSHDHGATWSLSYVDQGLPPGPSCNLCGWDFMGTGSAVAVDGGGRVYAIYNAPTYANGAPYVWFRSSTDGGMTWSPRTLVSTAVPGSWHAFPAVAAGAAGDVRIDWMDNRTGAYNVWYRSSTNGGASWSSDVQISQFLAGYSWITSAGFAFPYGDYTTINLDPSGHVFLAWGEGPSYIGPGNTFAAHN